MCVCLRARTSLSATAAATPTNALSSKNHPHQPIPHTPSGGIPVCFPQFGQLGPLGQHGFARNSAFSLVAPEDDDASDQKEPGAASATLALRATGQEDARFPHAFELRVRVRLSADGLRLRQELDVTNPSATTAFDFTAALHTYFVVAPPAPSGGGGGIAALSVEGLSGTTYSDSLDAGVEKPQQGAVTFDQEVDRIYLNAPDAGIVARNVVARGGSVEVRKAGFRDAVVWNPWADKARAMADFGDDEYPGMLCIEPAVAKSGAVTLEAGGQWRGWQELVYSPPP